MEYKNYETFIMTKGRDLEVSLFNYFFTNDPIEDCLFSLSLYALEDGGVSNIDPFNSNMNSTLPATLYFLNILSDINYQKDIDFFEDIIKGIVKYLKKQTTFSYYSKTNKEEDCSSLYMNDEYLFELEALTYAYIGYYSKIKDKEEKLKQLINKYMELKEVTLNQLICFKRIELLINNEELKKKIIEDTKYHLTNINQLVITNNDYLINEYPNEIKECVNKVVESKIDGFWQRNRSTSSSKEDVATMKYLGIDVVNNLLFFKRVKDVLNET